ncbi:hypothetical protein [Moorena producens]|uniref:hypothetical protein n=1 Tax=Moorena producens TaxID=1155739 RepID=UPI003C775317
MKPTPNPAGIHLSNAHQPEHFVGWALLETNSQSCRNSPEQCPPTRVACRVGKACFQLAYLPKVTGAMPTNQGTHCLLGLGGHCPFIL